MPKPGYLFVINFFATNFISFYAVIYFHRPEAINLCTLCNELSLTTAAFLSAATKFNMNKPNLNGDGLIPKDGNCYASALSDAVLIEVDNSGRGHLYSMKNCHYFDDAVIKAGMQESIFFPHTPEIGSTHEAETTQHAAT